MNIEQHLETFTDRELLQLKQEIEDSQLNNIENLPLLKNCVILIFGNITIPSLQVASLLWPVLNEFSDRMKTYSPYINV